MRLMTKCKTHNVGMKSEDGIVTGRVGYKNRGVRFFFLPLGSLKPIFWEVLKDGDE